MVLSLRLFVPNVSLEKSFGKTGQNTLYRCKWSDEGKKHLKPKYRRKNEKKKVLNKMYYSCPLKEMVFVSGEAGRGGKRG